MDYQNLTSRCLFCGGVVVVTQSADLKDIESTCVHCGYELHSKGNRVKSRPRTAQHGGYGTYHVQYRNGEKTFGCYPSPITGKDVEDFLRFIGEDPSVEARACVLIRNDEGALEALVGQLPPLYDENQVSFSRMAGVQYA